jgi:peptidoglycan-associated lipoprotein
MEIRALRRAEMRSRAEIPLQPEVAGAERLEPVYFDYDRHAIRPDQRPVLARHAELLKARPEVRVVLEGHCDERGSVEYNNSLGRKRAEAVRAYLVKAGVAGDRLSVVSYGEERPIETGPDPKARARNRRVELVLSAR